VNNSLLRWTERTLVVGSLLFLVTGCIAPYGGYGYDGGGDVNIGVGADYYEPYGVDYGGWGPGYHVAPYRGGFRGGEHRGGGEHRPDAGGHGGTRAFRSAPAGRSMPSLPSHGRSGGGGQQRR